MSVQGKAATRRYTMASSFIDRGLWPKTALADGPPREVERIDATVSRPDRDMEFSISIREDRHGRARTFLVVFADNWVEFLGMEKIFLDGLARITTAQDESCSDARAKLARFLLNHGFRREEP